MGQAHSRHRMPKWRSRKEKRGFWVSIKSTPSRADSIRFQGLRISLYGSTICLPRQRGSSPEEVALCCGTQQAPRPGLSGPETWAVSFLFSAAVPNPPAVKQAVSPPGCRNKEVCGPPSLLPGSFLFPVNAVLLRSKGQKSEIKVSAGPSSS